MLLISALLVIDDKHLEFSAINHNRVLFSKFVQGAPPIYIHGLKMAKITLRGM
jgi:hypothetical protein